MKRVELAYESYGDAKKPPMLILHGFFASSRNWRQIARILAEQFHVYVLDLRNHGASPHSPEMDYPVMAGDVEGFMGSVKLSSAIVMGHSMGGKVAMWLAMNRSERVTQLIVVDIAPVSYRHGFENVLQALKHLPLDKISNRKQAVELLSSVIPEPKFSQFLLQNLQLVDGKYRWRIDLDIFSRTAHVIPAFPSVERIPPFTGPTLFIAGGNSEHIKPEYKETILGLFPAAEIKTIPDTGHWLHVENPALFVKTVIEFTT